MTTLDLNADLGEGVGDDHALLAVVTSANVACGFHAGDDATMRAVAARAASLGVAIGAHVAYRDREGFGRRELDVAPGTVTAWVREQLEALANACRDAGDGARVRYVKPHGALYNVAARSRPVAEAICAGVAAWGAVPVLALPGSELLRAADAAGLRGVPEGFADRAYRPDGSLVPRSEPGAVLEGADAAAERALAFARGEVRDDAGASLRLEIRSLCLHGDTPGAVDAARAVRAALEGAGVELEPFAA
jgi:UPF0271 protein